MLYRLVGRAILSHADGVVSVDEDYGQPHQRRHPYRWPHVVGEHQKGAAEYPESTVERDAVEYGAHGVLTHAKVKVSPRELLTGDVPVAVEVGVRRRGQIGGAAYQLGNGLSDGVQHRSRCRTRGQLLAGLERRQSVRPTAWQLTRQHPPQLSRELRMGGGVVGKPFAPLSLVFASRLYCPAKHL